MIKKVFDVNLSPNFSASKSLQIHFPYTSKLNSRLNSKIEDNLSLFNPNNFKNAKLIENHPDEEHKKKIFQIVFDNNKNLLFDLIKDDKTLISIAEQYNENIRQNFKKSEEIINKSLDRQKYFVKYVKKKTVANKA